MLDNAILIVYLAGIFLLNLTVRILPIVRNPYRGCDAYYFLLCAEEFRKNKKIPITLPYYYILDDQQQWYPPGFSIFLSILPVKLISNYYWLISPIIDSIIATSVSAVTFAISKDIAPSLTAGLSYAFSLSAISETQSLNSRQLSSLFLNICIFSLFWFIASNNWVGFFLFLSVGFILLMTHKMATQILAIGLLILTLLTRDLRYVASGALLFLASILISKGFYINILKAHLDIVLFWDKNSPLLGAHQIYHSPVYGNPGNYVNDYYSPLMIFLYFIRILCANIVVMLIWWKGRGVFAGNPFLHQVLLWLSFIFIISFFVIAIPWMRAIGEGYKYIKYALPSAAILGGILFTKYTALVTTSIAFYAFLFAFWYARKRYASLVGEAGVLDRDFREVIDFFKQKKETRIICVPSHLSDAVAYYTRKQVFWGTHNFPFARVKDFFPVWQKRLSDFKREYALTHLLVDKSYVNPKIFSTEVNRRAYEIGSYIVYEV